MTYIFATTGVAKVFSSSGNVAYMNTRHLPFIPALLAVAAVVELGGSICLISGYQARIAAVVMFLYMIAVTCYSTTIGLQIQIWLAFKKHIFGRTWQLWAAF